MKRSRLVADPAGWLVTVDPGVHRCGVAVWLDGILADVAEVTAPINTPTAYCVVFRAECTTRLWSKIPVTVARGAVLLPAPRAQWWAETPQDYDGEDAKSETLEELRRVLADIATHRTDHGPPLRTLFPRQWKGNVPKAAHHPRLLRALYPVERAMVEKLPRTRDALDAVGVGLFLLGRTGRGGV